MSCCSKDKISDLAHQLWEDAGKPEGDGFDFWIKAEEVVCGKPLKVEWGEPPVINPDCCFSKSKVKQTFSWEGPPEMKIEPVASLVPTVPDYKPWCGENRLFKVFREILTRAIAYSLWEKAGKPEGDGVNFWLEAEKQIQNDGGSDFHC